MRKMHACERRWAQVVGTVGYKRNTDQWMKTGEYFGGPRDLGGNDKGKATRISRRRSRHNSRITMVRIFLPPS